MCAVCPDDLQTASLTSWVALSEAAVDAAPVRTRPTDLKHHPFFVADARHAGMNWQDLQARAWRRLSYGQYAWKGLTPDARLMLRAAAQRLPAEYAFSGRTAGWILGLDMPPCDPIEVTVPREASVRSRAGLKLRRTEMSAADVVTVGEFRSTSPMRTVRDLGSRRDLVEAVVAIDMAVGSGLIELPQLISHVATHSGQKGVKRLRRATALADPRAESPMETRLRIELIKARLPHPAVQVDLCDSSGAFLARADLYYADRKLVIEYDGENHKERLAADVRRQNALLNAGYHMLRFTAADLRTPSSVVAHVRLARARLREMTDRPDKPS